MTVSEQALLYFCVLQRRLMQIELQMGLPQLKLLQEVETSWNSTYVMLKYVLELRVGAALT